MEEGTGNGVEERWEKSEAGRKRVGEGRSEIGRKKEREVRGRVAG